ncbi:MAG: outer membrane lipid asymmetry maintenance protein MlaD [Nitrospirae bacterium GWC2_42_7]|nr:MAG: outer membrane lipid asymmetry maintenance protein MlaD [Nitrospirae bacterium GWC2_42_7]
MKKYSHETIVGIFIVVGLLCIGYMTIKLGKVSIFGSDYYPLYARFASVSGLRVDSPVEIGGIEVGRVEELSIDQEQQMSVVKLRIGKNIKVFDDASASIKTAGLIGDKLVKIDPGGAGEVLKPGSTITETNSPMDVEDLISKYAFGDVKKNDKDETKKNSGDSNEKKHD